MQEAKETVINVTANGETISFSIKGTSNELLGLLCDTIHMIAQQLRISDKVILENIVRIMVGDQLDAE